jgi:type IV pilus assembly protein PilV
MKKQHANQNGFTLIEVLVATVIMAVGLLGIVTMHGNAMFFTKDSESQWAASEGVFRIFEIMRPRLSTAVNGNEDRQADAPVVMADFLVPGPGGVSNNCPPNITGPQDELSCIQRDLEAALPGGRIESITLNGATLANGVSVQVSWLASFADADEAGKCDSLSQLDSTVAAGDGSINSGISAVDGCGSTNVRRVANWVMLP